MKSVFLLACLIAVCKAQSVQDYLTQRHNVDRENHQVGKLIGNADLAKMAQNCCNRNAARNQIVHDCPDQINNNLGENLGWAMDSRGSPNALTAAQISYDGWYNEKKDYDYKTGKPNKKGAVTGHFTQVVWKGTTEMGCASAQNSAKKSTCTCCLYRQAGNYENEFTKNVFRPKK